MEDKETPRIVGAVIHPVSGGNESLYYDKRDDGNKEKVQPLRQVCPDGRPVVPGLNQKHCQWKNGKESGIIGTGKSAGQRSEKQQSGPQPPPIPFVPTDQQVPVKRDEKGIDHFEMAPHTVNLRTEEQNDQCDHCCIPGRE